MTISHVMDVFMVFVAGELGEAVQSAYVCMMRHFTDFLFIFSFCCKATVCFSIFFFSPFLISYSLHQLHMSTSYN